MNYDVAIPSYQRPEVCADYTVKMLRDGGVPADRIRVFLNPEDPARDEYVQRLKPYGVLLERAEKGLLGARNAITEFFPQDHPVASFDDDVKAVHRLRGDRTVPVLDVDGLLTEAFRLARKHRVTLWGVSPTDNHFFMRDKREVGLWFAHGAMHGMFNRHEHVLQIEAKADYERSLQYYDTSGGSLRLRDICFKGLPIRTAKGGMQAAYTRDERRAGEEAGFEALKARWGGLVRYKGTRDGYIEVALKTPTRARNA